MGSLLGPLSTPIGPRSYDAQAVLVSRLVISTLEGSRNTPGPKCFPLLSPQNQETLPHGLFWLDGANATLLYRLSIALKRKRDSKELLLNYLKKRLIN